MDDVTCPAVVWAWMLLTEDDTSTVTSEQELQVEVSDALSERTEAVACIWWAEVSNTLAEGLNSVTVFVEKEVKNKTKTRGVAFKIS